MHFFRHTFQNFLYIIMETLLEGVTGCAQAHPVAPPIALVVFVEIQVDVNWYAVFGRHFVSASFPSPQAADKLMTTRSLSARLKHEKD
jgi:hypothetical protein